MARCGGGGGGRRLVAHEVGQLRRGPGGAVRPAAEGRGRVAGLSRSSWDGSGEVRRLRGTGDVGEGPRRGDRVGRGDGGPAAGGVNKIWWRGSGGGASDGEVRWRRRKRRRG